MAKISAATDNALNVIAHLTMASDLSKSVKGMEGFLEFYKKQLPAQDKAILRRFESLCRIANNDLAQAFKHDMKSDGR